MHNPTTWLLVVHIAGFTLWIGGLWMALAAARNDTAALANRALRAYAHVGAALVVLSGGALIYYNPDLRTAGWLHAKLGLVVVLIVFDLWLTARLRQGKPIPAWMHAVISSLFVLILILVLMRPF